MFYQIKSEIICWTCQFAVLRDFHNYWLFLLFIIIVLLLQSLMPTLKPHRIIFAHFWLLLIIENDMSRDIIALCLLSHQFQSRGRTCIVQIHGLFTKTNLAVLPLQMTDKQSFLYTYLWVDTYNNKFSFTVIFILGKSQSIFVNFIMASAEVLSFPMSDKSPDNPVRVVP